MIFKNSRIRNQFFFISKATISCLFLYFIFSDISKEKLLETLNSLNIVILPFIFLVFVTQLIFMSFRWKKILKWKQLIISFRASLRHIWVGQLFNQALPSTVGGDLYRVYALNEFNIKFYSGIKSIIVDRLIGLSSLGILVVIVLPIALWFYFEVELKFIFLTNLMLIIAAVLILKIFPKLIIKVLKKKSFFTPVLIFLSDIFSLAKQPKLLGELFLYSIFIHIGSIIIMISLSEALNHNFPIIALITVVPIMSLLSVLPISISGWGVREAIMLFYLRKIDFPDYEILSLSISYGFALAVFALPGAVLILFRHRI